MNQLQVLKETCQEHKLIKIIIQQTDSAFVNTLKGKLKLQVPYVRLIKNLSLKGENYSRRVNVLIKLKEKGLICVENWSEETDFILKVKSKQARRSKKYV